MQHIAILKNEKTGRYHPVFFRPAPRPSDDVAEGKVCRHKTLGHHTEGFENLDLAIDWIDGLGSAVWPTGIVYRWSGEDFPAMHMDFPYMAGLGEEFARECMAP